MRFWEMIGLDAGLGPEMTGTYDAKLVVLSIAVAALASYSALGVVERMSISRGARSRLTWHLIGATAMGCGIWTMHFTAMLALSLPVPVSYDLGLTALSVAPAIAGSACALHFMAQSSSGFLRLQLGALLMAVGIGLMHYTGMDAMQMQAAMRYDAVLFAVSILVAHVLASLALYIRFRIADSVGRRRFTPILGAAAMGCTVAGMHYTAMAAATYYDSGSGHAMAVAGVSPIVLATVIASMTTLFLGLTIIGVLIDRRMEEINRSLRSSEDRRRTVLQTMLDGLMTVDAAGMIESVNPAAERMLGFERNALVGQCQHASIHHSRPDGTPYPKEDSPIHDTLANGTVQEVESDVFWRCDGSSFPVEYISTPMYEEARLIGAVVTFRDISRRKQAEQERSELHRQLLDISRQAGQAEIATGVLHNVGNVLNSVTVSVSVVAERIKQSRSINLSKASGMLEENAADLAAFLTEDARGRRLPGYLKELATHLESERGSMLQEFESIGDNIAHIKEIVARQQSFASGTGQSEPVAVMELLDSAVAMNVGARHGIELVRDYADLPAMVLDKHRVLQIVVNLIRNAKQSVNEQDPECKQITLSVSPVESGRFRIRVTDNGKGIRGEDLTRVFEYGFSTKRGGHGFGLHSAANAATEMGGSLICHSEGPGKGATFELEIPAIPAEAAA